jgi:hypothetical protein
LLLLASSCPPYLWKQLAKAAIKSVNLTGLALPNDDHGPASFFKLTLNALIPGYVAVELATPELNPRLRHVRERASRMPVPKASVDKDHQVIPGKGDVGAAW